MILCESHKTKILSHIPLSDWREPSCAQTKNCFGHANQTRFRFRAWDRFGKTQWCEWLDDRFEADSLLWETANGWRPDIDSFSHIDFVTVVFLTSGTSWSVPSDCVGVSGLTDEFIDAIGAGGSGAYSQTGNSRVCGGAGGAWSRITSLALTPSSSVTIQVGVGGAAKVAGSSQAGAAGTDTYFNGASLGASSVGAPGGGASAHNVNGPSIGGAAASGVGTSKNSGGNSGSATANSAASGGGGAAGPNGNGVAGTNAGGNAATAGGAGDNGSGGSGGAGNIDGGAGDGNPGTEYDGSHGSGGGGGGNQVDANPPAAAGSGGLYGAGGGASRFGTASGAGRAGLIVVSYSPVVAGSGAKLVQNMPMIGM